MVFTSTSRRLESGRLDSGLPKSHDCGPNTCMPLPKTTWTMLDRNNYKHSKLQMYDYNGYRIIFNSKRFF